MVPLSFPVYQYASIKRKNALSEEQVNSRKTYAVVSDPANMNVASCPVISLSSSLFSGARSFAILIRTTART